MRLVANDYDITLYPDIIEASFAAKQQDTFSCWLILKAVDIHENSGSGWLEKQKAGGFSS